MAGVLDWLQQKLSGPGDDDPTASWQAMNPAGATPYTQQSVLPYLQDVITGQNAKQGMQTLFGADQRDLGTALAFSGLAAGGLGVKGAPIRAYHGSPHSFDKFSQEKIGTGEGAQAYGHGLYFAENEGVARQYRDKLSSRPDILVGGEPQPFAASAFGNNTADQVAAARLSSRYHAASTLGHQKPVGDIVKEVRREIDDGIRMSVERGDFNLFDSLTNQKTALDRMIERGIEVKTPGHMYEVNINADPTRLLDWDRPLSGQTRPVQDAWQNVVGADRADIIAKRQALHEQLGSNSPFGSGNPVDAYAGPRDLLQLINNDPARASALMNEAGIPGIRYLDQGSRAAGEGSSNYVVFDPSLIEILRKYGILPPLAAGGAAALAGGEAQAQPTGALDDIMRRLGGP